MDIIPNILEFLEKKDIRTASGFFDGLQQFFNRRTICPIGSIKSDIIDEDLITEIKSLSNNLLISFGKTLRDIRCTITDGQNLREHDIYLEYNDFKKLVVVTVNLPHSYLQDREYSSLKEAASAFQNYVSSLDKYFFVLEKIDSSCNVREPMKPTFKDDYRRILVDRKKTWLHVEVTCDGRARNIHFVGNSEQGQDKNCLLNWDYDMDIVENINTLFDTDDDFISRKTQMLEENLEESPSCCICFCVELPDCPRMPQPICQNPNCGAYYHRNCLFKWLVASDGGRTPAFGVANGTCPTCLQTTNCNEKDHY